MSIKKDGIKPWGDGWGSNPQQTKSQSVALPIELPTPWWKEVYLLNHLFLNGALLPVTARAIKVSKMAEREGLEPSRQASCPTSLANSPLHQLGYLSIKWLIYRHGSHSARRSPIDQFSLRQNWKLAYIGTFRFYRTQWGVV